MRLTKTEPGASSESAGSVPPARTCCTPSPSARVSSHIRQMPDFIFIYLLIYLSDSLKGQKTRPTVGDQMRCFFFFPQTTEADFSSGDRIAPIFKTRRAACGTRIAHTRDKAHATHASGFRSTAMPSLDAFGLSTPPWVPAAREDSILFGAGVAFGERGGLAGQASSETLTFPFGRSLRSRLHRKHRSPQYLTPWGLHRRVTNFLACVTRPRASCVGAKPPPSEIAL